MLTVIFGAGASYDSITNYVDGPASRDRPPLANDLFDPRFGDVLERYQQAAAIAGIVQLSDAALEEVLQEEADSADANPLVHSRLMATRYYLRDVLTRCGDAWHAKANSVTNYLHLATAVQKWQISSGESVCYVTFNYDTMLDRALEIAYGVQLGGQLERYTSDDRFSYIKPHGSVDWQIETAWTTADVGHRIRDEDGPGYSIPNARDVRLGSLVSAGTASANVVIPAIAIPMTNKDDSTFLMTAAQEEALEHALRDSDRVLMIGWAGAERHFLSRWSQMREGNPVETWCVSQGMESMSTTKDNLLRGDVRGQFLMLMAETGCAGDGFSGFVRGGGVKGFLEGRLFRHSLG